MKAEETDIKSIIEGTKQYVIPLYQRAYVWDKKNWKTFWDDISELCEPESNETHFFGSFVTMPIEKETEVDEFLLIDGQQRLTTIFVLLATLRDKEKTLKKEIEGKYFFYDVDNNDSFKLLPTKLQGDRDCFEQIIRAEKCTIDNRIKECSVFFSQQVAKTKVELKTLKRKIIQALRVVHLKLEKGDDPYKIFESLNAKGAELSQADLIRNHLFMRISEKPEESYDAHWEPMEQKLKGSLSEYLRHFLMKDSSNVKKNEVYFTLKKRIDGLKTREEVVDLLKDLAKFAAFYEKLLYPDRETNPKIRERLSRLNQIGFTIAYPFLLKIYDDYESQQSISEDQLTEIIDLLENFSVRRSICKLPTYRLNLIFPSLCKKSSKSSDFVDSVKIELSKKQYPSNLQFFEDFKTAPLYNGGSKARQKTKLILGRLASFENKEPVNVDPSEITIEHIMPQKLTPDWEKTLGEDCKKIHETLVNTIGNLTLSERKLEKLAFSERQEILKDSNPGLNGSIAKVEQWDENAIKKRADCLAKIALKIWPYFGKKQTDSDFSSSGMTGKKPIAVIMMGDYHAVSSWRDVMQTTLEILIDIDTKLFDEIIDKFPQYVAWENKFRCSRQLSNGAHIEININAQGIYNLCREVIELSGLSSSDWQVELIQ
ncbi:hypothetical protein PN36_01180 [Candidatus Thiomargarita nelsonii]|uniref:DUF262 domain-containing protein n=1 Tax=Candidatus Thiomargarita nelsonii TaxID=1003181 RepID=A0A0A6PFT8_9GAMM|nr:hypothetical protein PN36_01180 [Candidatus Thiomargarita nelsonii]